MGQVRAMRISSRNRALPTLDATSGRRTLMATFRSVTQVVGEEDRRHTALTQNALDAVPVLEGSAEPCCGIVRHEGCLVSCFAVSPCLTGMGAHEAHPRAGAQGRAVLAPGPPRRVSIQGSRSASLKDGAWPTSSSSTTTNPIDC